MALANVGNRIKGQTLSLFRDNEYRELRRTLVKALDKTSYVLDSNSLVQICNDTSTEKGLQNFWKIIKKCSVHSHPVTTWKFYVILHTMMIRGNPTSILEIAANVSEISEPAKNERADKLNPCFAVINKEYAKYLLYKIHFHKMHMVIPSSTITTCNDILMDAQYKSDVVMRITLSITEYVTSLYDLNRAVKKSLKENPEFPEIRAIPYPLLIDENYRLLYTIHDLMTYLHKNLPHDLLQTHRTHFKRLFYETHLFHMDLREMTFRILHSIPNIPEDVPKFDHNNIYPTLPQPTQVHHQWPPVQAAIMNQIQLAQSAQFYSAYNLNQAGSSSSNSCTPTPAPRHQGGGSAFMTSAYSTSNLDDDSDDENLNYTGQPPSYFSLHRSHSASSIKKY